MTAGKPPALLLHADSFYTFDRAQAQLARAAGLATPVRIRFELLLGDALTHASFLWTQRHFL